MGKWPTTSKLGDGTWFVWLDKITDTTMSFHVLSDTRPLGVQTLPFASRNTPTVVDLNADLDSTAGALTAPAWAFAKMYNSGDPDLKLSTMNFGPSYVLPVSANSHVNINNSRMDDGYTTITVKHGKITYLR